MALPFAETMSVVKHPPPEGGIRLHFGVSSRGPILPAWGTREREKRLREFWHHDYNETFTGAIAGLAKRTQSTPWEIKAPKSDGDRWQRLLMEAEFGKGWETLLDKLLTDYSRHDQGAFLELIAPGDPRMAPMGPVVGLAVLDSVRCYPTGNPTWPVIYTDVEGAMHLLHRGRVVQFVDMEDPDETLYGYGKCALSRAIASVYREILMGRYVEQFLDDKPPPGMSVFKNVTEEHFQQAITRMEQERRTDADSVWGHNLRFYTYEMETAVPDVTHLPFSTAPEKFDYEKYTVINVRKIALAIGLDIQDLWELTGGGIGTGTQSQIMAQKSRGKAFGRILKGLERLINRVLPEDVEFGFQYKDPQEDLEEAQKAQTWFAAVSTTADISPEERRQLLANQVPAVRDVVTDEEGEIRRLPDDDPKPDEATRTDTARTRTDTSSLEGEGLAVQKAFSDATVSFSRSFAAFIRRAQRAGVGRGTIRAGLRDELNKGGHAAYNQGLIDGEIDPADADAELKADRRRTIAEWVATQAPYIDSFTTDILEKEFDETQVETRTRRWANKSLSTVYYAALAQVDANTPYRWQYDPTKEHCETCKGLHGQIHKFKEWIKSGFLPKASTLDCGGHECGCELIRMPGAKQIGRLPASRVKKPGFVDRLLGWVRGLVSRRG